MIETAIVLFAAHVLADFLLQIDWIIKNKRKTRGFLAHVAVVAVTTLVLLGAWSSISLLAVAVVVLSHAVIDAAKLWQANQHWVKKRPRGELTLFIADQALHILIIAGIAWWLPQAWTEGWWSQNDPGWQTTYLSILILTAGFVLATRTGGFVIGQFMAGFDTPDTGVDEDDPGLKEGGKWIGLLERALIFILVMAQQFQAIGFLIAAKSILRFQYSRERSHSEIVIIGTLASFAWAIVMAWGTFNLMAFLNA
jgi:hypothetical protein